MTQMGKLIDQYGIGITAVIIIFVLFGWMFRKTIMEQSDERKANSKVLMDANLKSAKAQEEHNANQVKALEKVADSNNNVASALELIRDMFVDRTNNITNKQDVLLGRFVNHCADVNRIEALISKLSESVLKTEERTRQCSERIQQIKKGD